MGAPLWWFDCEAALLVEAGLAILAPPQTEGNHKEEQLADSFSTVLQRDRRQEVNWKAKQYITRGRYCISKVRSGSIKKSKLCRNLSPLLFLNVIISIMKILYSTTPKKTVSIFVVPVQASLPPCSSVAEWPPCTCLPDCLLTPGCAIFKPLQTL